MTSRDLIKFFLHLKSDILHCDHNQAEFLSQLFDPFSFFVALVYEHSKLILLSENVSYLVFYHTIARMEMLRKYFKILSDSICMMQYLSFQPRYFMYYSYAHTLWLSLSPLRSSTTIFSLSLQPFCCGV